jgi:hypothetical protein
MSGLARVWLVMRLYGLGTDLPAYPESEYAGESIVFSHGVRGETVVFHGLTARGEMTTRWHDGGRGPLVSSVDYRLGMTMRLGRVLVVAEHESDHNADRLGRSLRGNWVGVEVEL